MSSIRFISSGLNCFFNSPITSFFIVSYSWVLFSSAFPPANPSLFLSVINFAPTFDVIIITVFLKFTVLPWASVNLPSSRICNNIFITSGWAFSTSSNRITEYGLLLIFSVNCPPSSYPTYPGGAPINLATECGSINSDISTLIMLFSLPNNASANAFASSVLPTPVGPKNKNEPIGLFGSFNPTLPLLIAFATAETASSCPTTLLCKLSSRCLNFSFSVSDILLTGIPVQVDITPAISSCFRVITFLVLPSFHLFWASSNSCLLFFSSSLSFAAFSKFWVAIASSFSLRTFSISSSKFLIESGFVYVCILTFDAASSIKSIALSGKYLSLTYLVESSTADFIASSVIFTLWWASYLSLNPSNILIASSSDGSFTITGLNLLSRAASFSMYFLYSFVVVAPTTWISPLARSGFKIFAASTAPSAEPAPTIVWISSINRITSPAFFTSSRDFFILSSKSPLYFAPAIIPDISMLTTLLFFKVSGTSPSTIFSANPSAIAVLPTPGSPIKQGLFLLLLDKIWITLSISVLLPITGSSFPSLAFLVKSLPYWFKVGVEL